MESSARRDRDAEGRARNARPRDGLGRPLPYGAEGVARQPEGVTRSPEETVREAQRLLDAGDAVPRPRGVRGRVEVGPGPGGAAVAGVGAARGGTDACRARQREGRRFAPRAGHGRRSPGTRAGPRCRRTAWIWPGSTLWARELAGRLPGPRRRRGRGAPAHPLSRITSRVRGPCTPSTRSSSMSLVAEGPEIQVSGRARVEAGHGLRDGGDDLLRGPYDADVVVGHEGDAAAPLGRSRVQDDRAGLGDGQGAAGDDAVHGVEFGGRGLRGVGHAYGGGRGQPLRRQSRRHQDARGPVVRPAAAR